MNMHLDPTLEKSRRLILPHKIATFWILLLNILLLSQNILFAQTAIDPQKILIVRDSFGMAHIFAEKDAEVAYGLAWANAEDAFELVQETLILGKGNLGRLKGKEGIGDDFFLRSIRTDEIYESLEGTLSKEYLSYIDGYCQGINAFAQTYPERILLKKFFPIMPKDIIKAQMLTFIRHSGILEQVKKIVTGQTIDSSSNAFGEGNAYAFSSKKTKDAKTYLCINPHSSINEGASLYAVHLNSMEGLNILGILPHGGASVLMGSNENLGWGVTNHYMDQLDSFELKMHPKKKLWYEFNGSYMKLEKHTVKLKIRKGRTMTSVRRKAYWSNYGPTFKTPDGRYFVVKSLAYWNIQAGEQLYSMNKANNFEAFKKALAINALAAFNLVYADKMDNIYYSSNYIYSKHSNDFGKLLKEKPHIENPSCGYIFNMNSNPINASCPEANWSVEQINKYFDWRFLENNRSIRFMELVEGVDQMDWEAFKAIKFDCFLSKESPLYQNIKSLYQIDPTAYPQLSEPIRLMQSWDGSATPDSKEAAFFLLALMHILNKKGYTKQAFMDRVALSEADFLLGIEFAARFMNRHYNSLRVALKEVVVHSQDQTWFGVGGFPDMLSFAHSQPTKEGKMQINYGDAYIHFVRFGSAGVEVIEGLAPFKKIANSKKYKNELNLFNEQQLRSMSLHKIDVLENAQEIYHPQKKEK